MTNLKALSVTLTILAIATISNCRLTTVQPNDANLIDSTCKHTPNYNLCVQLLQSDPHSSGAPDVRSLALIMVDILKSKAQSASNDINRFLQKGAGNKKALNACSDNYKAILEADIPQAVQALKLGNPKFAEDGAADASGEAVSCERGFSGNSPLTAENNAMHDAAEITRAIIRLLL